MSLIWLAVLIKSCLPFSTPPSHEYARRVNIASCAVVAFVDATAFRTALLDYYVEIRAIVELSTFTIEAILLRVILRFLWLRECQLFLGLKIHTIKVLLFKNLII